MAPKPSQPQTAELFRPRLDEQINMQHLLVRLAALIDWAEIERTFAVSFTSGRSQPCLRVWRPDCCTCSTPSMLPTKLWSAPEWITRTGSSSAARPTYKPNCPSIRPA